jgi:hypothetical protein
MLLVTRARPAAWHSPPACRRAWAPALVRKLLLLLALAR